MLIDGAHFDHLTKRLSRRGVMQGLGTAVVGGTLTALGQAGTVTAAKSGKCKRAPGACETCQKGKCHKQNGKKSCKAGKLTPKAEGTSCRGGACQSGRCVAPSSLVLTPGSAGSVGPAGQTGPAGQAGPAGPAGSAGAIGCSLFRLQETCSSTDECSPTTTGSVCAATFCGFLPPTTCCHPVGGCCEGNCDCCGSDVLCVNGTCQ